MPSSLLSLQQSQTSFHTSQTTFHTGRRSRTCITKRKAAQRTQQASRRKQRQHRPRIVLDELCFASPGRQLLVETMPRHLDHLLANNSRYRAAMTALTSAFSQLSVLPHNIHHIIITGSEHHTLHSALHTPKAWDGLAAAFSTSVVLERLERLKEHTHETDPTLDDARTAEFRRYNSTIQHLQRSTLESLKTEFDWVTEFKVAGLELTPAVNLRAPTTTTRPLAIEGPLDLGIDPSAVSPMEVEV
jgi:hypothetical protein